MGWVWDKENVIVDPIIMLLDEGEGGEIERYLINQVMVKRALPCT